TYEGFEQRDFDADVTDPADLLRRRILRSGIELERLWVQWCTEALAELGAEPL
ncbi:MAG: PadR family transcriptional regulator, partial [Actinomycetales bacterium]